MEGAESKRQRPGRKGKKREAKWGVSAQEQLRELYAERERERVPQKDEGRGKREEI